MTNYMQQDIPLGHIGRRMYMMIILERNEDIFLKKKVPVGPNKPAVPEWLL